MPTIKTAARLAAGLPDFRLALAKSSDQVIISGPEGTILYVNDATERLSGRSRTELIGKNVAAFHFWGSYLPGRLNEKLKERTLRKKKEYRTEVTNRRQDGTKYLTELRVFPVPDAKDKPKFLIGLERNITPEKELDDTKTDFISLASHQLRTPLTNMSLSVEVLLRDPSGHLSDYQKDCLQGIHGEIRKMADLIATLLDVSKIQLGNFVVERKLADVLPAAEAALERVLPELNGKGLKLIKSFAGSIPSVLSDKNIIQVVLENLLSNAVKYTPPQGLITVSIRKQRNRILITVKDNGCGIPKGQQHRIFSKYFRAGNALMREAQGVGLGLYMCKLLIESVAGRIWFESRENEGATFYVSLPLAAPAQPSL